MSENDLRKSSIFEKIVPALLVVTVGLAFLVGTLWQKVENLNKVSGITTDKTAQQQAPEAQKVDINTIKGLFDKDLVKFGDKNSKLIFVEVSDPSCPYCHIAAGLNPTINKSAGDRFKLVKDGGTYVAPVVEMKKLVEENKAAYVWIYMPGHGNGELASKALYCANETGKFWNVHDLLMTNEGYELINNVVSNDIANSGKLAEFLKSAYDYNTMKSCLESDKYNERLKSDALLAAELGVTGTPGFFVNENRFAGAYSYKDMQSVVESALK